MPVSLNNVSQVNNTQPIKQPTKKTDEKSKSLTPTQTNIAIGAGLTALAAIGIYFATRGRGAKSTEKAVAETVKGATQTTQESANTVKANTVEAFKKDKVLKEGGTDFIYNKDGNLIAEKSLDNNITLYHSNGKLKFKQEGNTVKSFDENGNMTHQLNTDLAHGTKSYQLITSDARKVELRIDSQNNKNREMSFYEPNSKRPSATLATWYDHTGKRINEAFARTKNGDRYLLEKGKDGVFQLSKGEVVSARYNPKNKEVELLNDNLKEESVPVMVDNVLKAITDMRKQHKQARTMIDTYWSSKNKISDLLSNNEHFMK